MVNINEIIKINSNLGGFLLNRSNLEFAVDRASREKDIYKSNAHLLRGIVQGHPFLDGNKSTATNIVLQRFNKERIKCDNKSFEAGILKLSREKNSPIVSITRRLKRWCKKR